MGNALGVESMATWRRCQVTATRKMQSPTEQYVCQSPQLITDHPLLTSISAILYLAS